jgi:hypothetical protein
VTTPIPDLLTERIVWAAKAGLEKNIANEQANMNQKKKRIMKPAEFSAFINTLENINKRPKQVLETKSTYQKLLIKNKV